MHHTFFKTTAACLLALVCTGAMAGQPVLKFNSDNSFKVLQLTDTHIRTSLPEEAAEVYARMDYMVETEKPDFIVMSGDVVTVRPAAPEWDRVVSKLDSYGIPWCVLYGNHDAEQDLTRPEMSQIVVSGARSVNTLNTSGELADIQVPVYSSDGKAPSFYVFCMDSHDYEYIGGKRYYGWFSHEQVNWLRNCCLERTSSDGKVAPSFAFFHIPLREYVDAWSQCENPREETTPDGVAFGIRGEKICCGGLNTGMFEAMKSTGSVIGMTVGHDHDNDFIAAYMGLALCYGRFSGADTVGNHLPGGARLFLFRDGVKGFETWIREDDGRVVRHAFFDGEKIITGKRDRAKAFGTWYEISR